MGIDFYGRDACHKAYERYREIRRAAYLHTLSELREMEFLDQDSLSQIRLEDIGASALQQSDDWTVHWSWRRQNSKFSRYPDAIRTALWHGSVLCGMGLGRVSKGKLFIRVHFLQGSGSENPLRGKVAAVLLLSAEKYGIALGVKTITIERPVPDLVCHYEQFGFTLVEGKRFYRMVKSL